eukprot:CAMPEP_0180677636 /NCGR_PEP_ID=MMETSP1037_2-20121125/67960_1 /TAXON_ID=632150 /ORGANISM="Azadinium spinosum, Strain 3D9" /LENGTH=142 /DNA_ID=CAMNT_0022707237 /DNA_START=126 /DNA_END=554 /DNA_ORIENTATION=+
MLHMFAMDMFDVLIFLGLHSFCKGGVYAVIERAEEVDVLLRNIVLGIGLGGRSTDTATAATITRKHFQYLPMQSMAEFVEQHRWLVLHPIDHVLDAIALHCALFRRIVPVVVQPSSGPMEAEAVRTRNAAVKPCVLILELLV